MDKCSLTYSHYERILEMAMRSGYVILPFEETERLPNYERALVLRHDIDSKIDKSIPIAKIEKAHGIRSTYFVRSFAEDYDLEDQNVKDMIKCLVELNHEIGLHYETGNLMKHDSDDPEELFLEEKHRLERSCGFEVLSAASHSDKSQRRWMRSNRAAFGKGVLSLLKRKFPHGIKNLLRSAIVGIEVRGIRTPLYSAIQTVRDDLFQIVDKQSVGIKFQSWDDNLCRGFVHAMEGRAIWKPCCPCRIIGKYDRLMITTHPEHWSE